MSRRGDVDQVVLPRRILVEEDDGTLSRVGIIVEGPVGEEILSGLRERRQEVSGRDLKRGAWVPKGRTHPIIDQSPRGGRVFPSLLR